MSESNQPIQAPVPFASTVQGTMLPKGNYGLMYSGTAHILSIRGLDRNSKAAFAMASSDAAAGGPAKLVFYCYGNGCRLAQVWQGSSLGGSMLRVPPNEQERKLAFLTRLVSVTIPAK